MRFLAATFLALACGLGAAEGALAEPPGPAHPDAYRAAHVDRIRFGPRLDWTAERLGRRVGLGVGWSLPQRWYDADGELLTERSLVHPGDDLERSGLYLALRF